MYTFQSHGVNMHEHNVPQHCPITDNSKCKQDNTDFPYSGCTTYHINVVNNDSNADFPDSGTQRKYTKYRNIFQQYRIVNASKIAMYKLRVSTETQRTIIVLND